MFDECKHARYYSFFAIRHECKDKSVRCSIPVAFLPNDVTRLRRCVGSTFARLQVVSDQ